MSNKNETTTFFAQCIEIEDGGKPHSILLVNRLQEQRTVLTLDLAKELVESLSSCIKQFEESGG